MSRPTRIAGTLIAAALLAVTAACGATTDPAPDDAAPGAATESSGAFPVSVTHKFGTTEVPAAPQRVVTVGLSDQDAVLALGVKPVGVVDWYGDYPDAVWPWQAPLFGADVPEVVGDASTLNFESIAALEPDLVLGLYSGLTQEQYDTLSAIAPTVAQPTGFEDYSAPWQDMTRLTGQALGQAERADELVADVEERFARTRAENPELTGLTAAAAGWNEPGQYFVYGPDDPKTRFLADIGFTVPPAIQELSGPDGYGIAVSAERLDLMNQDLGLWFTSTTPELRPELDASPVYQNLRLTQEGRDLFLEAADTELNGAISWSTVLSLPIAIDEMLPKLPAVIDGDPATAAPATAS